MSVDIIGPDGKPYTIDEAELPAALRQGFKQPVAAVEEDALGDAANVVGTTALSAVSGLTGGLSDVALGKGDSAAAQFAQSQRAAHPIAAAVGEIGGSLVSPLNEAAKAVQSGIGATTALGKVGAGIAGGSVVGGLFGAGKTLSDASLGDTQLTAESLLAGAGLGALLGGAGGGIGEAVVEGAGAGVNSLRRSLAGSKSILDDLANDAAISSTRATQHAIDGLDDAALTDVGTALRERGHLKFSPKEMAASLAKDREGVSDTLLQQLGVDVKLKPGMGRDEAVDAIREAMDKKYGPAISDALDAADKAGARPKWSGFTQRLNDFEAGLNPVQRDTVGAAIKKVRGYIDEAGLNPAGSEKSSFKALNDIKTSLQADINYKSDSTLKNQLEKQLVGILRDEIDTQLAPQAWVASDQFQKAKKAYGLLARVDDSLTRKTHTGADAIHALLRETGHATPEAKTFGTLSNALKLAETGAEPGIGLGFKDLLAGDLLGKLHPFGVVGAVGSKVMREYGPAIVARLADKISKSAALQTVAKSFAAHVPELAPQMGPYGQRLVTAAAQSPAHALAEHIAHSQVDPSYSATAQLAGLTHEAPGELSATLTRAKSLTDIQRAQAAQSAAIEEAFKRISEGKAVGRDTAGPLGVQDFGSKRMRQESPEAFKRRVEEIRRMASDPSALLDRTSANTAGVASVAPGMTAAMTNTAQRAVAYLSKQAEMPTKPGPLAREWAPTDAQRHSFALKLEAVQAPMSILKRAADGTLTKSQVDAVRAVYPAFARDLENKALEMMASGRPMPYRSRLMLSLLTGVSADGTTTPRAIAGNQSAISNAGLKPSEKMQPQDGGGEGLNLAAATATASQKREMVVRKE